MLSTPILNAPQTAILGMHTIQDRPVAIDGEIVVRPMMYLALSYDHRIIDGNQSVGFLIAVKEGVEDPENIRNMRDSYRNTDPLFSFCCIGPDKQKLIEIISQ